MVTIFLVGISWQHNFLRIGMVVMWIHDLSDIPIDMLKLANYLKMEGRKALFLTEIMFAACLLVWAYLRLYIFPVYAIFRGAHYGVCAGLHLGGTINWTNGGEWFCPSTHFAHQRQVVEEWRWLAEHYNKEEYPYYNTQVSAACAEMLLVALLLMHIWWYMLLLKLLKRVLSDGAHEAGRQGYEGDDEKALRRVEGANDQKDK